MEAHIAPPGIPPGCICNYTWHSAGDGRSVRNGPIPGCQADHTAIDAAAHIPAMVRTWAREWFRPTAENILSRPAQIFGGKSAIQYVADGDGTWDDVIATYEATLQCTTPP